MLSSSIFSIMSIAEASEIVCVILPAFVRLVRFGPKSKIKMTFK